MQGQGRKAKDFWLLPEGKQRQGGSSPPALPALDFRTVREQISVVYTI
jgi:hypothetical protein